MRGGDLNKIAEQTGVSKDVIEEVESHFYKMLRVYMRDPNLPTIKLKKFGVYRPYYNRVKYAIISAIDRIRAGKDVEESREELSTLWKVRDRLIRERKKNNYG